MEINWIIIITSLISTVGTWFYIKDTLLWKTKPNRINWLIWWMAPLIGVTATFVSEWFVWSMVPVFMAGFMPLMIVLASFVNKNSYWKLAKLDYICLALAILSIIGWTLTSSPLVAIILVVIVDLLWGSLMLKKMFQYPETENIYPFLAWILSNWSALYFVKNWKAEEYLFPLYLFSFCIVIVWLYFRKNLLNVFRKNSL